MLKQLKIALSLALILSMLFYFLSIGKMEMPFYYTYFGFLLVSFGLLYRWYAVRSLGRYFRVKVSLITNQKLITTGMYANVRHPSYTGLLCYYLGFGLLMQNIYSLLIVVIFPVYVVLNRIQLEEQFLLENFGEAYKTYQKKTYQLIRFIY